MGDSREKLLPGIDAYIDPNERGFSKIAMLLEATGGLSLSQVCAVTGLEGSTIQNWVKRGWVAHTQGKRYEEVHIARILIINALKECIKLEHIALLMSYVNGESAGTNDGIIKESELFDFLCEALGNMGQASDHSRGGIEGVVDSVIKGYKGPKPDSRARIRKALSLMIYACVCSDVKRRTEMMMIQILHELENPEEIENEETVDTESDAAEEQEQEVKSATEAARKTVSQALREWDINNDISSVERIIIDHTEEGSSQQGDDTDRSVNRPWYSRRK